MSNSIKLINNSGVIKIIIKKFTKLNELNFLYK